MAQKSKCVEQMYEFFHCVHFSDPFKLSMFCSLAIFTAKYWSRVDTKQILSPKMGYEIELLTCVAPSLCA